MDYSDLEKLDQLRRKGVITDEEFEVQKQRFFEAINRENQEKERRRAEQREEFEQRERERYEKSKSYGSSENTGYNNAQNLHWGMSEQTFCTVLHLGIFAGYLIPFLGWILPLVMWLTEKEKSQRIDTHGKIVVNWLITYLIFGVVLAWIPFIGWLSGAIMLVCNIVFAIIGAVKASEGETYQYPLSIRFIH